MEGSGSVKIVTELEPGGRKTSGSGSTSDPDQIRLDIEMYSRMRIFSMKRYGSAKTAGQGRR
jgi:hypothetical protein